MSLGLVSRIKSGLIQQTALSGFWQLPFGSTLDPEIPNLPLDILPILSGFPTVVSVTTSNNSSSSTTYTPVMPTTVVAGELLIIVLSSRVAVTSYTGPAGWTEIADAQGGAIYWKKADGTEGGASLTWTYAAAGRGQSSVWRITDWDQTSTPEIASFNSTTNTPYPDPPSLTPSWGVGKTLWISALCISETTRNLLQYPFAYDENRNNVAHNSGSEGQQWSASRRSAVATENPTPFGLDGNAAQHLVALIAVKGISSKSVIADLGSYSITGQTANTKKSWIISAAPSAYTVTGQIANLKQSRKLLADISSYTISGQVANFKKSWIISAAASSYSISGQVAGLVHSWKVSAGVGTYSLTGFDASLVKSALGKIIAEVGNYDITGVIANIKQDRKVLAAPSTYTISGQIANIKQARKVLAASSAYAINGQIANIKQARKVLAASSAYAINGQIANIKQARKVLAVPDAYVIAGIAANISYTTLNARAPYSQGFVIS